MSILKTYNVTKLFDGIRAVDCVNLAIEEGTITAIVGPNGAGKTTLANIFTGVIPFDKGTLCIKEQAFTRIRPHEIAKLGITRTFQNIQLFEQMSVLENILVILTKRRALESFFERTNKGHLKKAHEILSIVGLWEKCGAYASQLSYGQRKLLEIGRALAMNCPIILLDEPFAGLFPQMVATVAALIEKLRDKGHTIVLIEHNMDVIRELSDYVIVMDSGRLLAAGKPDEVLARKDVMEAYLGE